MLKFSLFLSFLFLSTIAVFAQNAEVCDVQLKAYAVETIREENPVQLGNVEIIVKNSAGKILKPSKDGANLYAKLSGGDYEIVATLAGYKTSIDKFSPFCPEETVPPVAASVYVFMWKGDPKEKVNRNLAPRGILAVGASDAGGVKRAEMPVPPSLTATRLISSDPHTRPSPAPSGQAARSMCR